MKHVSVIGLDLAKNVFQVHGVDEQCKVVLRKQLRRSTMLKFFARLRPCLIGIEACASGHYWHRELTRLGHDVRMMAPVFVKPYLKSNKNDRNDAEAICEAVQRPSMRFVRPKTVDEQSILHAHHARRLLIQQRVALGNHIRGMLLEFGLTITAGSKALNKRIPEILEDAENQMPMLSRHMLSLLKEQYDQLVEQADQLENQIKARNQQDEVSQRLMDIPGVGPLNASALSATLGNGSNFRSGRQFSAYLGLVPRQWSSGGKDRLLGISKRGDSYLRTLLIHGARTVIRHIRRRLEAGLDGGNVWIENLLQRCHPNEVAVALANKMARIAWALTVHKQAYAG
ncbi:MAG: IS110 family transposase [Candidatus Thiodiazotropha sp.]